MTTLPNMSLVLPIRGAPGSGAWADTLDTDLALTDAHDHSSGKGARVPSAGLNINADISFSSLYAPKNLHRAQFSEIAGGALSGAHNLSLFVSDGTGGLTAHELYFRTSTGTSIKFTSGSSLNVSAFTGGIGGDYTAVSALVDFDDANKQYRFRSGGGANYARVTAGGLRLIEFGTSETLFVGQIAPAALASSYTMTWPTALPGSTQLTQIDSGGQVSFTNTVSQLVTFSAGATLGNNQNLTLQGTGDIKRGSLTKQVSAANNVTTANGFPLVTPHTFQIPLDNGDRVLAVRARVLDNTTGPTKITVGLHSAVDGVLTTLATSAQSAGTGLVQTIAATGLSSTMASGTNLQIRVIIATGAAACTVYWIEVDYDRP